MKATGEWPIVVWDKGGSNEKAKEGGDADLLLDIFVGEKNTNNFFGLNQTQGAQGKDQGQRPREEGDGGWQDGGSWQGQSG